MDGYNGPPLPKGVKPFQYWFATKMTTPVGKTVLVQLFLGAYRTSFRANQTFHLLPRRIRNEYGDEEDQNLRHVIVHSDWENPDDEMDYYEPYFRFFYSDLFIDGIEMQEYFNRVFRAFSGKETRQTKKLAEAWYEFENAVEEWEGKMTDRAKQDAHTDNVKAALRGK